jgi:hypothetical protein
MKKLILIFLVFQACSLPLIIPRYETLWRMLTKGKYEEAVKYIEEIKTREYPPKDALLYFLDLGIIYHYAHQPLKSNFYFEKAERLIEDLFTKSLSAEAISFLIDDNVLPYQGEDYEDIYINIFKALNYLKLEKFDEAFVEVRRVNQKLRILEEKYQKVADFYNENQEEIGVKYAPGKNTFFCDALACYLSFLIYRAEGKFDDSEIDRQRILKAWRAHPQIYYHPLPPWIKNPSPPSNQSRLNIIAFVGRAPLKYSTVLCLDTYEENVVVITSSQPEDTFYDVLFFPVKPGYHFKFALPKIKPLPTAVSKIEVIINNQLRGELFLIEDLSRVAQEVYKVKAPIIYLKTILRAFAKGIAAQKVEEKFRSKKGKPAWVNLLASGLTKASIEFTEKADLRSWQTMPDKCFIGEYLLSPGIYDITLRYYTKEGRFLELKEFRHYEVKKGKLNLLETISHF